MPVQKSKKKAAYKGKTEMGTPSRVTSLGEKRQKPERRTSLPEKRPTDKVKSNKEAFERAPNKPKRPTAKKKKAPPSVHKEYSKSKPTQPTQNQEVSRAKEEGTKRELKKKKRAAKKAIKPILKREGKNV